VKRISIRYVFKWTYFECKRSDFFTCKQATTENMIDI
jgi:hypothetical protein